MARASVLFIVIILIAGMTGCAPAVQYSLTVTSTEGGKVTVPGEGTFSCYGGRGIILMAAPRTGYHFVNWTGDVSTIADVNSAQTTITMCADYSITANFEKSVGGWCFIATAAYDTPMAREIGILRDFRDKYLLTNALGRGLADIYYRTSPPIARLITEHPGLKPLVKTGLVPLLAMCSMLIDIAP